MAYVISVYQQKKLCDLIFMFVNKTKNAKILAKITCAFIIDIIFLYMNAQVISTFSDFKGQKI